MGNLFPLAPANPKPLFPTDRAWWLVDTLSPLRLFLWECDRGSVFSIKLLHCPEKYFILYRDGEKGGSSIPENHIRSRRKRIVVLGEELDMGWDEYTPFEDDFE